MAIASRQRHGVDRQAEIPNTSTVIRIDTGIAVSEISVGRKFPRKKYRITATTTDAAISLPWRLPIEASMKLAWRNVTSAAPCRPAALLQFSQRRLDRCEIVTVSASAASEYPG